MKRSILLLHGFKSNSRSYFLPDLQQRYGIEHTVYAPDMPSPEAPDVDAWTASVTSLPTKTFDLVIAHSLGGALAWSLLTRDLIQCTTLMTIGSSPGPKDNESMNTFLKYPFNFDHIRAKVPHLFVVHSLDDPWTYAEYALSTLRHCHGTALLYADKGHFECTVLPPDILTILNNSLAS